LDYNSHLDDYRKRESENMALNLDKFTVTFKLAGSMDANRVKEVEFLPDGVDIAAQRAQLDTDITTWLTNFNNVNARDTGVSTAFVTGYVISEHYFETDNIPGFTQSDNLYLEALVGAQLEGTTDNASLKIPAPSASIFVNDSFNSGQIDQEDAGLETFLTQYTEATGNNAAISDGQQWQNPINVLYSRILTAKAPKRGI
jgi:hypothetical protein